MELSSIRNEARSLSDGVEYLESTLLVEKREPTLEESQWLVSAVCRLERLAALKREVFF
jgi:hypothetical protein